MTLFIFNLYKKKLFMFPNKLHLTNRKKFKPNDIAVALDDVKNSIVLIQPLDFIIPHKHYCNQV